ncbi:MAG: hypothetical protein FH751_16245 [Firmicutes bacterium]|nr:hypothetical protein [Bacillota bacterium]
MNIMDLIDKNKKNIIEVAKKYNIEKVKVSALTKKGKKFKDKDIKLLISFNGENTLYDLLSFKKEVNDILKRNIDVSTIESIHPDLRKHINETIEIL